MLKPYIKLEIGKNFFSEPNSDDIEFLSFAKPFIFYVYAADGRLVGYAGFSRRKGYVAELDIYLFEECRDELIVGSIVYII